MSARYLVDTNILLRFLSGEPPNQAEAARRLFEAAAAGTVILEVSPVIVAEVMYTLTSFYRVDRTEAATNLAALVRRRGVKVGDADQVFGALKRLEKFNVGFGDAFLAAGAAERGVSMASFDRDIDKFKDVSRIEPA